MKRDNPGWRDLYGHWWVEIDADESYGWWPARVPLGARELLRGCGGILNGMGLVGRGATWHRDSAHGRTAAHAFHPVLVESVTDDEVRARIRRSHSYAGAWRWAWRPGGERDTCRSFQDQLLAAAGLFEGVEHLPTRGRGCPFLYRPRTLLWAAQDAAATVRSLIQVGDKPAVHFVFTPEHTTAGPAYGAFVSSAWPQCSVCLLRRRLRLGMLRLVWPARRP